MSNIGKKIIKIDNGVTVLVNGSNIDVSGPKGNMSIQIPLGVNVIAEEGFVKVQKTSNQKDYDKYFGLARSLIANMVKGVSAGFEKKLELTGVGYRARLEGSQLVLNVGYVNPVRITPPQGISFTVDENIITVSGINKELVGNTTKKIHEVRPPDSYKQKGIKIMGEFYRKKVGKAAKAVGGK